MIAIIDYGCGNLYSLASSLTHLAIESEVTGDPARLAAADKLILPGVGAFGDAAQKLRDSGLFDAVREQAAQGKHILGICLGMQLLFEKSYEYGEHEGLALLPGQVCPLAGDIDSTLKIPHMGWNALRVLRDDPILAHNAPGDAMYFVHSYYAKGCGDALIAAAEYDIAVPALVGRGNVYGAQFHPEKSGSAGLRLLTAFAQL